jgi:hypothetical protein
MPNRVRGAANPEALVRILTTCPGVTLGTSVAVLGVQAPAYQLALAAHGFARATAASQRGAALLRERYGCLCVMDQPSDQLDATALAALRRRLVSAGTLIFDVSTHRDRAELERQLRAAGFWMMQYRMIGLRQADGERERTVLLVARAPRSPLCDIPADVQHAAPAARRAA